MSYVPGSSKEEEIDELLKNRDQILADLELQLQKAKFHMKQNFDRNWKELLFAEGDLVFVKVQPNSQHSILSQY